MIAARDERDPLSRCGGRLSNHPPRSDVHVVAQIAGRRDDGNRDLWFRPASHEVRRDQHGPVHREDRGRRIVRSVAHGHNGYASLTDRIPNGERDLAVDRDPHRDGATPLHEISETGAASTTAIAPSIRAVLRVSTKATSGRAATERRAGSW